MYFVKIKITVQKLYLCIYMNFLLGIVQWAPQRELSLVTYCIIKNYTQYLPNCKAKTGNFPTKDPDGCIRSISFGETINLPQSTVSKWPHRRFTTYLNRITKIDRKSYKQYRPDGDVVVNFAVIFEYSKRFFRVLIGRRPPWSVREIQYLLLSSGCPTSQLILCVRWNEYEREACTVFLVTKEVL